MELLTVINATHITGFKLKLSFNNGEEREVDLSSKLNMPVFEPLKDISYFKKFSLNPFTVEWDCGADFAPKYLYDLANQQDEKNTDIMYK
jgi:hypothetical protein